MKCLIKMGYQKLRHLKNCKKLELFVIFSRMFIDRQLMMAEMIELLDFGSWSSSMKIRIRVDLLPINLESKFWTSCFAQKTGSFSQKASGLDFARL